MKETIGRVTAEIRTLVAGSACVVFSCLTPDQIRRFQAWYPEALQLTDEKTGEVRFTLDRDDDGPGALREEQAVYGHAVSADGKATMTILIDPAADDPDRLVQENLGSALRNLAGLEKQLLEKLPELEEREKAVTQLAGLI